MKSEHFPFLAASGPAAGAERGGTGTVTAPHSRAAGGWVGLFVSSAPLMRMGFTLTPGIALLRRRLRSWNGKIGFTANR